MTAPHVYSKEQYPELHQAYVECCEHLSLTEELRLYLLQSDGLVNALALRFLNRNYVVVYSGIVDALDKAPESLRFYLGHELCHIVRGHLKWSFWLRRANLLSLLGPAYARAEETTCYYYGLACCKSAKDAVRAMAVMACGSAQ
jgi:Zn-dependent protease with chaperone function